MRLNFKIPIADLSASLPAAAVLQQVAHIDFQSQDFGHRHPCAIYRVSISAVNAAFQRAFRAYDAYFSFSGSREPKDVVESDLIFAIDHLLDAVAEHFDDARSVIRIV